jgi:hypothetical protein
MEKTLSDQARKVYVEKEQVDTLDAVTCWEKTEGFLYGLTADGKHNGWMHFLGGNIVWNHDTREVVRYVPPDYR